MTKSSMAMAVVAVPVALALFDSNTYSVHVDASRSGDYQRIL